MPRVPGILPICCRRLPRSEPPARGGTDTHRGNRLHAGQAGGNSSGTADGTIWARRERRPLGIPPTRFVWTREGKLRTEKPNRDIQVAAARGVVGSSPCLAALRLSVMGSPPWRRAGSWPCCEMEPSIALMLSVRSSSPSWGLQAYVGLRRLGISPKLAESHGTKTKASVIKLLPKANSPPPSHQQDQLEV